MTETGWPLIPREVLPAPVPAVKRPAHPRPAPTEASRQLPFFGAETTDPSPADLAGLLAGPGHLGRMGGTARVSVVVEGAWRVHVLVAELVIRGLVVNWRPAEEQEPPGEQDPGEEPEGEERTEEEPREEPEEQETPDDQELVDYPEPVDERESAEELEPGDERESAEELEPVEDPEPSDQQEPAAGPAMVEPEPAEEHDQETTEPQSESSDSATPEQEKPIPRFEVLTAYSRRLNGLAQAWPRAAAQLFLSGPRLRLWVAAAGEPVPGGYALGLDPGEGRAPAKNAAEIDAALVRAGLAGRLSDDGRQYLIMGKRRVARLAELVGERPDAAPAELWPGGAAA